MEERTITWKWHGNTIVGMRITKRRDGKIVEDYRMVYLEALRQLELALEFK